MFCRKCGKQILDDSKFCQYCGVEVREIRETRIDKIVILSEQEAKNGVEKEIEIDGIEKPLKILFPKNTVNEQVFRLHKVKMINSEGKKIKKDVHIKIEITN